MAIEVSNPYAHEVGLLRQLAAEIVLTPHKSGPVTETDLRALNLVRAKIAPAGIIGIKAGGETPLREVSKLLFERDPEVNRGSPAKEYQAELFGRLLETLYGKSKEEITDETVRSVLEAMRAWFDERAARRTIFVVCSLSPWPSPEFEIGPVLFTHYESLMGNATRLSGHVDMTFGDFRRLLDRMREERAHWLATVELDGYDAKRGYEIADLAVDLALVAIQLAAPYLDTRNLSRLDDRRGTGSVQNLALANGHFTGGYSNVEAGLSIGDGTLTMGIVAKTQPLILAVGNCIRSFISGHYRLRNLEQAWCDAAYWLHQALAEPLDTIAVTKLETAIEVLMRAVNGSGSERRTKQALEVFFGLKPEDRLSPHTQVTAQAFAKTIVGERSRILHGTSSTLFGKISDTRAALEHFATCIIRGYVVNLDRYLGAGQTDDALDVFLDWIKANPPPQKTP